mmetsp:Transcript_21328/g.32151  ORF Transcript_21328/g.32151 Transcript_21328/m.32151 type:complete len:285 (-) Transcript_21328:260-1114(-)
MCNKSIINVSKPAGVLLVPLNSVIQPFFPRHLFCPPKLMQFTTVDSVPQVIEFPVWYECDQLIHLIFQSEKLHQLLRNIQVTDLIVPPNIKNHTRSGLVQNDFKCTSHILHIKKVTCVASIPMQGHRLATQELISKLWNQLFRELMRSIDVVTTGDNTRKLKRSVVRLHQKLCPSFCGGIGVGRFKNVLFRHGIGFEGFSLSIHFIRRDMNESLDSFVDLGSLEKDVGAIDVALGEVERITKGVVHVRLGSKVHDGINVLFGHNIRYEVRTADVSLDEFEVFEA